MKNFIRLVIVVSVGVMSLQGAVPQQGRPTFTAQQKPPIQQQRVVPQQSAMRSNGSKADPLEAFISQQKKEHTLTAEEEKQLKELEKKENRARAQKALEYLLSQPHDYEGARENYLNDFSESRQNEIVRVMIEIIKCSKAAVQKACQKDMSEDSFCTLKRAHDQYEEVELGIMQGRDMQLQRASQLEYAYSCLAACISYVPTKIHLAATALGCLLVGRFILR